MNHFDQLEQAITTAYEEGELPEFLLDDLRDVAHNPEKYAGKEETVRKLIEQLNDFELFADTGCFKGGYDTNDVRKTLALLNDRD